MFLSAFGSPSKNPLKRSNNDFENELYHRSQEIQYDANQNHAENNQYDFEPLLQLFPKIIPPLLINTVIFVIVRIAVAVLIIVNNPKIIRFSVS